MDKLAEEILKDYECALDMDYSYGVQLRYGITIEKIIEAMQAYHEAKLKEELIKFAKWFNGHIEPSIACGDKLSDVDEYLKQRNK